MNTEKGFSLVELMVGLTIGLLVLAGALQMYTTNFGANAASSKQARFEQTVQIVLDQMVSELRRAGYFTSNTINPIKELNLKYYYAQTVNGSQSCITYSHSQPDLTIGASYNGRTYSGQKFYGFKLSNNIVFFFDDFTQPDCSTSTGWTALTDTSWIVVDTLTFLNHSPSSTGNLLDIRIVARASGLSVNGSNITQDKTVSVLVRNST